MKKRILSLLLALVLVLGMLPVTVRAGVLDNGLEYEVYGDHVEITGYTVYEEVVVIPARIEGLPVTALGMDALAHHPKLTTIELPDTLTSIGDFAFYGCDMLTSIEIPDSVAYIGRSAFNSCTRMTGIHVGDNNPNYYSDDRGVLFTKDKTLLIQAPGAITEPYTIPDGVTDIQDYAFRYCRKLTGIEFPDSLTRIGMDAFEDCNQLTSLEFPDGLTYIGYGAFRYCDGATSLYLPDSLTYIGEEAFYCCSGLTSITIPDNVTYIGDSAFSGCTKLTGFHVDENNPYYLCDSRGVLYDKDKTKLLQAPGTLADSYTIPDGVTSIGDNAFLYCQNLTRLDIPDSVTLINQCAFMFCESLAELTLPAGITDIHYGTFYRCRVLPSLEIPDGVTSIGQMAFYDCITLESVSIPDSVTYIDSYAFHGCVGLLGITIPSSVTRIDDFAFEYCIGLEDIYFEGDAPEFGRDVFSCTFPTIYYPAGNATWTEEVMQDYGAFGIEWVPYTPHVHEYTAAVTAPTCMERGFTTYTCACGKSYVSDYTDPLGHEYADGICIRCGAEVENLFTDVPEDSFYYDPVLWALANGITKGSTADTFDPDGKCLRAHVVTFLHRAEGKPAPCSDSNPFTDVESSDFFYAPVLWAVEKGITNGVSAAKFGSYDVCNRAAVVTFLWRAAGSPEPTSTGNPFTDVKATDFFYKPVLWAVENGITNGISSTEFGPAADCNRAQVVTFLYRAYN